MPEDAFNQSICLSMVDTTRLSFSPQTGAIDIGEDFKVMILLVMYAIEVEVSDCLVTWSRTTTVRSAEQEINRSP
jgi:hypothetical protein